MKLIILNLYNIHIKIYILFIKYITQYLTQNSNTYFSTLQNPIHKIKTLKNNHTITLLQNQTQITLNKYIKSTYPSQPFHFNKLLLLLPLLQTISSKIIKNIFFKQTIKHIPINKLIINIFKSKNF